MADPQQRFDMIDLDPYGSVAPFLDAALQVHLLSSQLFASKRVTSIQLTLLLFDAAN